MTGFITFCISRINKLKYSKVQYSLMLDCIHGSIIAALYEQRWQLAGTITSIAYKGWVGGSLLAIDTGSQAVCSVDDRKQPQWP